MGRLSGFELTLSAALLFWCLHVSVFIYINADGGVGMLTGVFL